MVKINKNIFYISVLFIPIINSIQFIINANLLPTRIVFVADNNRLINTMRNNVLYPTKNTTTINIATKIKKIKIYDVYDKLKKIIDNSTKIDLLNYKKGIPLLKNGFREFQNN